jgi:hypothetical protein
MVWNAFTGKQMAMLKNAHQGGITSVIVAEGKGAEEGKGALIISSGFDRLIRLHELRLGDGNGRNDLLSAAPFSSSICSEFGEGSIAQGHSSSNSDTVSIKSHRRSSGGSGHFVSFRQGADEKLSKLKKLIMDTRRKSRILERTTSLEDEIYSDAAGDSASCHHVTSSSGILETLAEIEPPSPPILPQSNLRSLYRQPSQMQRPPGVLMGAPSHRPARLLCMNREEESASGAYGANLSSDRVQMDTNNIIESSGTYRTGAGSVNPVSDNSYSSPSTFEAFVRDTPLPDADATDIAKTQPTIANSKSNSTASKLKRSFMDKVPSILKNKSWPISKRDSSLENKSCWASDAEEGVVRITPPISIKSRKPASNTDDEFDSSSLKSALTPIMNAVPQRKPDESVVDDVTRHGHYIDRQKVRQELKIQLERLKKAQKRLMARKASRKAASSTTQSASSSTAAYISNAGKNQKQIRPSPKKPTSTSNSTPNVIVKAITEKIYTLHPVSTWSGHTGDIYCLTLMDEHSAGSGGKLISGSLDQTVKIWDRVTGDVDHTFLGHTDTVTCVVAKGNQVFSGSLDRTIRRKYFFIVLSRLVLEAYAYNFFLLEWDTSEGRAVRVLYGNSGWVKSIDVTDRWLVSGGWDESVKSE